MLRRVMPLLALVCLASPVAAQQNTGFVKEFGTMWTFDAPPLAHWKATYNFSPDAAWLENVRLASVRIPGCSASFVSQRGLVMTNHHCARSCISAVSPADTNFQETGFVANSLAEERACPGMYADQLISTDNVTDRVQAAVTATDAAEAESQRAAIIETLQTECQTDPATVCQVVTFFNGGRYSLYKYHRYSDMKLVFAPEEEISFFGGDPDNFTYPRYDLDVTFLRVYDGAAPLQPKNYFRWSKAGAAEGDLVFVTGNPGSTGRLLTLSQMHYLRDVQYPAQLGTIARQIAAYKALSENDAEARRKYENNVFSLENAQKAILGYRTGLLDSTIMGRKAAFEADFRRRVNADRALRTKYTGAWDAITAAQKAITDVSARNSWYGSGGSQLLSYAIGIVRLPKQEALPDSLRLPQYRGGSAANARASITAPSATFELPFEKQVLAAHLKAASEALPANDPYLTAILQGRTAEQAANALLDGTKLTDAAERQRLVEGGASAVAASTDPLVVLARTLDPILTPIGLTVARQNTVIAANGEKIGQAIFAAYGTSLPPDATFTLRISDGVVKGFPMNGTVAPYRTSFYGLFGRSAEFGNKAPWHLPARWKARESAIDLSAPLDFVATNDIIGGNSGSPVINRNAEVVGLIFDGNIEMLPNRFIYSDEVARSVSVHSAGIIEALRSVYQVAWLADELQGLMK